MAKPYIHAQSSARKFGGKPDDYLDIHETLDSCRQALADNRSRALSHNAWFIATIIPKIYGATAVNSDGRTYSPKDVAELHVLEDYGMRFIPSAQDFLAEIEFKDWMNNGQGVPPSCAKLVSKRKYVLMD